jgi:hypothetical protein
MSNASHTFTSEPSAGASEPGRTAKARRGALERERLRVQTEIVSYPMPIPACDVYFNGLLERRAWICEQLALLDRQEDQGRN